MISSGLSNQVLKCGKLLSRKCGDDLSDFSQCSLGGVCVSPTSLLLATCSLFLRTLDIVNWTQNPIPIGCLGSSNICATPVKHLY